jgi:transposase
MPPPYSMDLRTRVLADCDAGLRTGAVAQKYTVSPAWVRRLKQRRRETGETRPRQGRPGPKPKLAAQEAALRDLAAAEPDLGAQEYRDRLGAACSAVTVWRALRRLGLTFKKK